MLLLLITLIRAFFAAPKAQEIEILDDGLRLVKTGTIRTAGKLADKQSSYYVSQCNPAILAEVRYRKALSESVTNRRTTENFA